MIATASGGMNPGGNGGIGPCIAVASAAVVRCMHTSLSEIPSSRAVSGRCYLARLTRPLGQQLRCESLPLRDPLDLDGDGVDRLFHALETRQHFEWQFGRTALLEPSRESARQRHTERDDGDHGEQCDRYDVVVN